jgi:hypothetical protein
MIILGVFSTRGYAEEAQRCFALEQGFRDYPNGFIIHEAPLDSHMWTGGFVTWQQSLDAIAETK